MIRYIITESQVRFLTEKLKPSQFRDYVKVWKDVGGEEFYNNIFNNKNRLYIDLESYTDEAQFPEELKTKIDNTLKTTNWGVRSYINNVTVNLTNGRTSKITKVITKDKNIDPNKKQELINLLNKFYSQKSKGESDNYMVAISRHPYDIVGMSTDRGWTSCTNLDSGKLRYTLINDVKLGTIIAYLIKKSDKNIENPQARVLIKPFVNKDTNEIFLFPEPRVYGTPISGFKETVMEWLDRNQKTTKGKYELVKGLHNDGACSIDFSDENSELLYYLRYNDFKRIQKILFETKFGESITKSKGCDLIYYAILLKSDLSVLQLLLNHHNIDPSCDPNKTIIQAIKADSINLVPLLLRRMKLDNQTAFDVMDELLKQYEKSESTKIANIIKMVFEHTDPSMNDNRLLARHYKMNNNAAVQLLLTDDRVKDRLNSLKTS